MTAAVLLMIAMGLAQDATATAGAPRPAARPSAAAPARDRDVPSFTTFGEQVLRRADLVAEARAVASTPAGRGVAVVRFEVDEVLLGAKGTTGAVVLAAPGEFQAGAAYLVFLRRFGKGGRYAPLGRIAAGERDYAAKRRVLGQYVAVERIRDPAEKARAVRDVLVQNVADADLFVKWNALNELRTFATSQRALFGDAERARLVAAFEAERSATFRRVLGEVLAGLGVPLDDGGSRP